MKTYIILQIPEKMRAFNRAISRLDWLTDGRFDRVTDLAKLAELARARGLHQIAATIEGGGK